MRNKKTWIISITLLLMMLTGCSNTASKEENNNTYQYVMADESEDYDISADVQISFSSSAVSLSGITSNNGISIDKTTVHISIPGTYEITGNCSSAAIKVILDEDTYPEGMVKIILNEAQLSNTSDSVIYVSGVADEFILTVKKNTANTISDGTSYSNGSESCAAIFVDADMKINGNGTLTINGNADYGILCKKDLKIYNCTLNITAVNTAIKGKDSVRIGKPDADNYDDLKIRVVSNNGDGIKATESEKDEKGYITINGGSLSINSYADCLQAAGDISINGGIIDLYSYEGSSYTASNNNGGGWGGFGHGMGMSDGNSNKTEDSAKGIKADGNIVINGGTINIDTSDDSIHCAETITINGGMISAATADDGIHSDNYLIINGGEIHITKSYEGLEATNITINDGDIHIISSDDGINAAGNKTSLRSYYLEINGGYIYVLAEGDGIDSNGSARINGGTLLALGPTSGGNSPLDCENGLTCTGGSVMAIGTSQGMWNEDVIGNVTGNWWINTSIGNTSRLTVSTSEGEVLSTITLPWSNVSVGMAYCNASFGTDSLTVYSGGNYSLETNQDGYGSGGTLTDGTLLSQSYSDNHSDPGGGMDPGGHH